MYFLNIYLTLYKNNLFTVMRFTDITCAQIKGETKMMKTEKSKLATLGLMIFTMIFLRMNNYDNLSTIHNEIDCMDIDPTFLIVSIREILSTNTCALWILLCTTVFLIISRHHPLNNKLRIIEVSCSILMEDI